MLLLLTVMTSLGWPNTCGPIGSGVLLLWQLSILSISSGCSWGHIHLGDPAKPAENP
jgi:hypothetical protein